jgi:hypothetical protein
MLAYFQGESAAQLIIGRDDSEPRRDSDGVGNGGLGAKLSVAAT